MSYPVTVTGRVDTADLGMILPHEHLVTDLRPPDVPGFGQAEVDVAVAVHTSGGPKAVRELDLLAAEGLPAHRYVCVHAQTEPDPGYHREEGRRGGYLEYDGLRSSAGLDAYIGWIRQPCDWGLQDRVMLSQGAGWYRPGEPRGGQQAPFDFLPRRFLPRLRKAGFSQNEVLRFTSDNPKRAFARE